jgi:hypothetical protein
MAIEEPAYSVLDSNAAFELRQYAPILVAEVELDGKFDEVGNRAFRILADYIFGNNRKRESISMTAPVSQQASEKIAMTAPVTQMPSKNEDRYVIAFTMPARYTRQTLPEPVDERIRIREIPPRLVAARRYSGGWSERRYREQEAALLKAIEQAQLGIVGTPVYARYNSPFSLWFMRRNEVLVEVQR